MSRNCGMWQCRIDDADLAVSQVRFMLVESVAPTGASIAHHENTPLTRWSDVSFAGLIRLWQFSRSRLRPVRLCAAVRRPRPPPRSDTHRRFGPTHRPGSGRPRRHHCVSWHGCRRAAVCGRPHPHGGPARARSPAGNYRCARAPGAKCARPRQVQPRGSHAGRRGAAHRDQALSEP